MGVRTAWPAIFDMPRHLDQVVRVTGVGNGQVIPVVGCGDRPYGVGCRIGGEFSFVDGTGIGIFDPDRAGCMAMVMQRQHHRVAGRVVTQGRARQALALKLAEKTVGSMDRHGL